MESAFINRFRTVEPKNCYPQKDLLLWLSDVHRKAQALVSSKDDDSVSIERFFQRYGVKDSLISQRFFECDDIQEGFGDRARIYSITEDTPNGMDIKARAKFFSERSFEVFKNIYNFNESEARPQHLIHVTCTGYVSPSAAQLAVSHPAWEGDTEITHAYHMGCYASLPAIRLAHALVLSSPDSKQVDIVHNEMCGLHMNVLNHSPEQIVVQTLFADGHAKYTVSNQQAETGGNLKIVAVLERLIPDSAMDMSWISGSHGMQMNLSREVPTKIKAHLEDFISCLLNKAGYGPEATKSAIFAIHPGGPKIIETVKESLGFYDNQVRECQKILFERGNMSSATLPHVWDLILRNNYPVGSIVISLAFGPGLTVFGSVFEIS
ncbi:MAG: hypothetical protein WCI18_13925 [Pseudomonadota bacterium]